MKKFLAIMVAAGVLLGTLACMLFGQPRGPLSFQPDTLPAAQAGGPYETKITISGNVTPAGEFSISAGALPPGLTLETVQADHSARIFGTPAKPGTYTFKVFVWCYGTNVSGQEGEKEYTLVVK
jgi:hypothetical protein